MPTRIDWTGAVLVSSGLVMLLLTITQAGRWGFGSTATWLGFATAAALLATWAWAALRHADPLLDVRLMLRRLCMDHQRGRVPGRDRAVRRLHHAAALRAGAGGIGASPLESGVYLLPMTFAIMVSGLAAGRLERRFDPRTLLLASGLCHLAALRAAHASPASRRWRSTSPRACTDSAPGCRWRCSPTLIVTSVAEDETGAAAGINNVARTLGGAVGGQIAAVLLVASGYTAAFAVGLVAMIAWVAVTPLIGGAHRSVGAARATAA